MKRLCLALSLMFALFTAPAWAVEIEGKTEYDPHTLVNLQAKGVPEKSAILWRVYPSDTIDRADTSRDKLQFAAKPGLYRVELLVIGQGPDGGFSIDEDFTEVRVKPCCDKEPPQPLPPGPGPNPPDGHGRLDPLNALGRIRFGSAGCTATVIGPRRPDGRWDVLTAAHCMRGVGEKGTITLRGTTQSIPITIVSHHKTPDVAWAVTDGPHDDLPYAMLATSNPAPGTPIWHAGYGVDTPGNREDGVVAAEENRDGQIRMTLSVSSGDSGGGIFRADTNEVISTVCCTSGMARKVSMWGGSTQQCNRHRPARVSEVEPNGWSPLPIPIREYDALAEEIGTEWTPLPMPIRRYEFEQMKYLTEGRSDK